MKEEPKLTSAEEKMHDAGDKLRKRTNEIIQKIERYYGKVGATSVPRKKFVNYAVPGAHHALEETSVIIFKNGTIAINPWTCKAKTDEERIKILEDAKRIVQLIKQCGVSDVEFLPDDENPDVVRDGLWYTQDAEAVIQEAIEEVKRKQV